MFKLRLSMLSLAVLDSALVYFATAGVASVFSLVIPEYLPAVLASLVLIALIAITEVRCYKIKLNSIY